MFESASDETSLAEQIYRERYEAQLQRDFPGQMVAIDIASKRYFVGEGAADVMQKVHDEKIETIIFIKQIGSSAPFRPWQPSLGKERNKAFMEGRAPAYTISLKSDSSKAPYITRKVGNRQHSLLYWSTRASAEESLLKFREKVKAPDLEVVEVSRAEVEPQIRAKSTPQLTYVMEMLP